MSSTLDLLTVLVKADKAQRHYYTIYRSFVGFWLSVALMAVAAALLVRELLWLDPSGIVYLLKTTTGDAMAGKLDEPAWHLMRKLCDGLGAQHKVAWAHAWYMSRGMEGVSH